MPNPTAEAFKAKGNGFFKTGKYALAIAEYKKATEADSSVPAYW